MTKIDDGGPAFPTDGRIQHGTPYDGMSLRDHFAGQALAESTRDIWANHKYEDVAKRAYAIADAMIAARKSEAQ